MTLQGGDELRARLAAIADSFEPVADKWQKDAANRMRGRVHSPRGRMRGSIVGFVTRGGFKTVGRSSRYDRGFRTGIAGRVFGDWRLVFQDKGTRAHDITPKRAKNVGYGYGTPDAHFAKRLHVRGVRKKPFIQKSAREAFRNLPMAAELMHAWNMAGGHSKRYALRTHRKAAP